MKDLLKEMFEDNIDGICFIPEPSGAEMSIRSFNYKKKQKGVVHDLGHVYHIILYKQDFDLSVYSEDNFTAILTDPHVYADWIISCGFYGVISRKTKGSTKFMNDLYKKLLEKA